MDGVTRCIVVGVGGWGMKVARRIQFPDVPMDLVGVCDVSRPAGLQAAATLGVEYSSDPTALVVASRAKAAVVATPPSQRVEVVRTLLAAGVEAIRIEKPLAATLGDAEAVDAACCAAGVNATVGHTTLWHPCVDELREILRSKHSWVATFRRFGLARPAHAAWPGSDLASHDLALCFDLAGTTPIVVNRRVHDLRVAAYSVDIGVGWICAELIAGYAGFQRRDATFTSTTGTVVEYDEAAGTIHVDGQQVFKASHTDDPLGRELRAWMAGDGTPLDLGVDVVAAVEGAWGKVAA